MSLGETRCLVGDPGRVVVFARRAGDSWFVAGINGTAAASSLKLDLTPFAGYDHRVLVAEGADANLRVAVQPQSVTRQFHHEIPARGGFILRLEKSPTSHLLNRQ